MKHFRIYMYMLAALLTMGLAACSEDDDKAPLQQYGYAQFKVVKEASYSRAAGSLDKLADAHKVKVVMQYGGSTISQTLVLDAYNAENAEFGLRSEKIELMAGEYTIIGYYVYGKLDEVLLSGTVEDNTFTVVAGGLTVKELPVDVIARGMVSFRLIKSLPQTRASEYEAYPFANIRVVDINIKNTFTKEITSIKTIPVT